MKEEETRVSEPLAKNCQVNVLCISRRKKYSLQIRFKFSDIFMFGCVRCELEAKDSVLCQCHSGFPNL